MSLIIATNLKNIYNTQGLTLAQLYYNAYFINTNKYILYKNDVDNYLKKWRIEVIINE